MAFQKSDRQLAIEEVWLNSDKNILCGAVAGSGKTTTLMELLKQKREKSLFLAFNKTIQVEIEERIEKNKLTWAKSMTMHGIGFKSILNKVKCKVEVKKGKNYLLVKEFSKRYKRDFRNVPFEDIQKLGYTLSDLNDVSRMYLTDDLPTLIETLEDMDKCSDWLLSDRLSVYWNNFKEIREEFYNYREKGILIIDFIDMIYLPVYKNLDIPLEPTLLYLDECQDFNICQHAIVDKILAQPNTKKFIAVGDRNQAIYGFAGASAKSFDSFLDRPNTVELPLDICYRCPPNIVNQANMVFDVMNPFKKKDGKVGSVTDIKHIKDNSLIICRNVKPIFELYFRLLNLNVLSTIIGDDIPARINRLLKPYKDDTVRGAKVDIEIKLQDLRHKRDIELKKEYFFLKENVDIIDLLLENICEPYDKVSYLVKKLDEIFNNKDATIKMCSIHKSKGLEADVVYILNEKATIPSKFAISPNQKLQEQNLKYVARTRAKEELYYLNLE